MPSVQIGGSAPTIHLDNFDPENKFPLKPLKEYERLFTEFLDMAMEELTPEVGPIEVFGHVNGLERICEVSFDTRPAKVILAIWLGRLAAESQVVRGNIRTIPIAGMAEPLPETDFDPLRRFHDPQPERCEEVRAGSDITWQEP